MPLCRNGGRQDRRYGLLCHSGERHGRGLEEAGLGAHRLARRECLRSGRIPIGHGREALGDHLARRGTDTRKPRSTQKDRGTSRPTRRGTRKRHTYDRLASLGEGSSRWQSRSARKTDGVPLGPG